MYKNVVDFIQKLYDTKDFLPLHEPRFIGNEKKYVNETIDTTFVSSVGKYVTQFEEMVAEFSGAKYAVATSNGTSALHVGLKILGVDENCEVITNPYSLSKVTFVIKIL